MTVPDIHVDGVLSIWHPSIPAIPLVFDSPHSGLTIPASFGSSLASETLLLAADTHVDDLFDTVPTLGAPLLAAHFPRTFLDLNRSLLDLDPTMLDGPWPEPVRDIGAVQRGMGLLWRYAWEDIAIYEAPLAVAEATHRIDRYYRPYHEALAGLIDAAHVRFGVSYHVNCHSMPAYGHRLSPDPSGTPRADMVIGDYEGASSEPEFPRLAADTLRAMGYRVTLNHPFKGAELVAAYSDPDHSRHSIQIEINRRLYMDEVTRERSSNYHRLKGDLRRLSAVLAGYANSAARRPSNRI